MAPTSPPNRYELVGLLELARTPALRDVRDAMNARPMLHCSGERVLRLPGPVVAATLGPRELRFTYEIRDGAADEALCGALSPLPGVRSWTVSVIPGLWCVRAVDYPTGAFQCPMRTVEFVAYVPPRDWPPSVSSHGRPWIGERVLDQRRVRDANKAAAAEVAGLAPSWSYRLAWQLAVYAVAEHCNARAEPLVFAPVFHDPGCNVSRGLEAYHEARASGRTPEHALKAVRAVVRVVGSPMAVATAAYERGRPGPRGVLVTAPAAPRAGARPARSAVVRDALSELGRVVKDDHISADFSVAAVRRGRPEEA